MSVHIPRIIAASLLACAVAAPAADIGWPHYAHDPGGTRYSPLDQIDASNLDRLEIAWQFRTGELGQGAEDADSPTFEATPVQNGRAQVGTPVTNAHIVSRLLHNI